MSTFLYFGYGSNLKRQRLHINCPSAELVCAGRLDGYRLCFFSLRRFESRWRGAVATIQLCKGATTWGAVWRISHAHSKGLDRQEGIVEETGEAHYRRVEATVVGHGTEEPMLCRTYEVVDQSPELEGLPSPQYLQVMLSGAAEVGLPEDYQQLLRTHPHNNYQGDVAILSTALEPGPPCNMDAESFLYFAYASNLNKKRLNVSCSSAELVCAARLDGYSIKFVNFRGAQSRWCGAVACAYENPGGVVWGAVWRIGNKDGVLLDKQEGSNVGLLRRKPVEVHTASGEDISCYLYQATDQSSELEGLPSPQYLQVIISGAEEVGLPEDYQQRLKQLPHNGYQGEVGLPDSP